MTYQLKAPCGTENEFDDKDKALDGKDTHEALCGECSKGDVELIESESKEQSESETKESESVATQVDTKGDERITRDEQLENESLEAHEANVEKHVKEAEVINSPEQLSQDPIGWLESINNEFVNTIKGKPAISKQGFRFIQSQFGITTESDVVQWVDEPTGCVVWAKAKLPDGQSAEAHGEGYLTETDVDDNEFVRFADTRAKNRAISDLTSAGALAVSELTEE